MDCFVISLERTPHRLIEFNHHNSGLLNFEVIPAVDGEKIKGVSNAVFDGTAKYSRGSLGCALSHISLWRRIAASGRQALICEDDAILHKNFKIAHQKLINTAPSEWDLIRWGWNFDSILHIYMSNGLGSVVMSFDELELRKSAEIFPNTVENSSLYRLRNGFGSLCYSLSPKGANTMLNKVLPIRDELVEVPGLRRKLANFGLDVAVNKHFDTTSSFVSFPPLAISLNDKSKTTILSR